MLTLLRAVAAGRTTELRLERANGENLRARAAGQAGMVALSKDKGAGRGVFCARQEVPVATAERVFAAYLAGEPEFDRGLKWQPAGSPWAGAAKVAVIAAGLALAVLALRSCA